MRNCCDEQTSKMNQVLNNYSDMVYKIAFSQCKNKHDTEDIFQNVFVQYIKSNIVFESEEHLKAWLIRVTINFCHKTFNNPWKKRIVELNTDIPYEHDEPDTLHAVVMTLPSKYRLVIHLFYYEDMSISQISNALDIKESTIKSQLNRGRNMLKEKLGGSYNYE